MQTRVLLAALLAVLVGLAGCTGGVTEGTTTEATTTQGQQALQSTSTTVSNFSYPEGASPSGIESVATLLDEHEAALAGTSLTLAGNQTYIVDVGSEREEDGFGYTVEHDGDATLTTLAVGNGTLTAYVADGTQYYRVTNESGTTYGTAAPDEQVRDVGPNGYTGRNLLSDILGAGEYEATDVVARNGTELVRYDLERLASTPDNTISGDVQSADGTVYVDSDGVVREATMTITTGFLTYEADVHFEDVGETSVTEPDWLDRAR